MNKENRNHCKCRIICIAMNEHNEASGVMCDGTPPLSPIQGVGFDKIDKCLSRSRRLAAFNSLKTCYALRKRFFKFNFSEMEMVRHPAYK